MIIICFKQKSFIEHLHYFNYSFILAFKFQSHTIMHCMVALAMFTHYCGFAQLAVYRLTTQSCFAFQA